VKKKKVKKIFAGTKLGLACGGPAYKVPCRHKVIKD
jgi:hypothetical protein